MRINKSSLGDLGAENKKEAFVEPLDIMPEQLISSCLHVFLLMI